MGMQGLFPLLVPAKVFKSDFSLLGCAATPRNAATKLGRKLHRWLEGIEKGGKRKTDFSYLIFPFSGDLELTLSENRASKWSNKRWNLDGTVLTPAFLLYSGKSTQHQRPSELIINFFCLRSWSFYIKSLLRAQLLCWSQPFDEQFAEDKIFMFWTFFLFQFCPSAGRNQLR